MQIFPAVVLLSLSGVFTAVSYPGFLSPFFLFIAFIPALYVFRRSSLKRAFLYGVFHGGITLGIGHYWMIESLVSLYHVNGFTAGVSYVTLTVAFLGIYNGLFGLCASFLMNHRTFTAPGGRSKTLMSFVAVVLLSLSWPALEYLRGTVFPAVNLTTLASCFYRYPSVLLPVNVLGEHLYSFIILLINGLLYLIIDSRVQKNPSNKTPVTPLVILFATTVLTAIIYIHTGVYTGKKADTVMTATPPMALVQANIAAEKKWKPEYTKEILDRYISLTKPYAAHGAIIIWPETALNFYPQLESEHTNRLIRFIKEHRLTILTGAPEFQTHGKKNRYYNSVFSITDTGIRSVYRKEKLVPFAEYCPLRFLYPLFKTIIGTTEYSPGKENKPVVIGDHSFGLAICFETTFSGLIKNRAASSGALLFLSDDVWLGRGPGPAQHLAGMVVRAIETQKWILSCVNSGIPAVISPKGIITKQLEYDTSGVLLFRD